MPTASNPGAPLDPEAHASCPGHVVWFSGIRNDRTEYGCEGWKKNGHHDRYASLGHVGSDGKNGTDRKTLIANNKASAAQEPERRRWVHDWLASERGLAATPHAQRSRASVRVELRPQFDELPLVALLDAIEAALGTPVQTAVKRVDEQAFARLNAENLMFCEDAARRVASVLANDPHIARYDATVAHYESLHPHDAVARVSGSND